MHTARGGSGLDHHRRESARWDDERDGAAQHAAGYGDSRAGATAAADRHGAGGYGATTAGADRGDGYGRETGVLIGLRLACVRTLAACYLGTTVFKYTQ